MTQTYDPATQMALNNLEQQILRQAQVDRVPVSIDREAGIPNPYYSMPGSREAYEQYGIPPVVVQNQPYATAAYMTQPSGSVSPLVGFPSVYPHVLNGIPQDYAAPYVGSNFAAGGTYGYDPNVAVQQAQQLIAQVLMGNPTALRGNSTVGNGGVQTLPVNLPTGVAASHDPTNFDATPVIPYPPGPMGPGASGPPPLPIATTTPNMSMASSHANNTGLPTAPIFSGAAPAVPDSLSAAANTGLPTAPIFSGAAPAVSDSLSAAVNTGLPTAPIFSGAAPAVPDSLSAATAVTPLPFPEVTPLPATTYNPMGVSPEIAASNAAALSGADREAWDEYLATGRYRSIYYPDPQTQAIAQGLIIPEGRDPFTPNEWMTNTSTQEATVPAATNTSTPTAVQQTTPELSSAVLNAMQSAAATLDDPNASWGAKVQARLELLQLISIYGMNTGVNYLGQSVVNAPDNFSMLGRDLARASQQGGNQLNSTAPMLMPKPVMTPMGPILIP